MYRVDVHRFWRSAARSIPGTLLVGLTTSICYGLGLSLTVPSFLYLIVVVLQSLLGDFASSAVVSIVAAVCLNYFFVPPILSFRVSDSSDIWALIAFLGTGLVITRLTTRVGQEAKTSEFQRHEMKLLYELAQRLLALEPEGAGITTAVELFCEVFSVQAICLYDGAKADLHSHGESLNGLADRTRAAYISRQDDDDKVSGIYIRHLRAGSKIIGAIGFDGLCDAELTAGPLTALATTVLERARVFRDASDAAAAAQSEVFRGAILDALAHEFKTPLATIVTAAGGLRELGNLSPEQVELAKTAETEASRLGLLTSRLLRIAQLDREEVRPQLELIDIVELVADLVEQYAQRWPDRSISVTKGRASIEVLADAELLRLAARQLLDNACKYSQPGSAIKIGIGLEHESVTIRVWNSGQPVAARERAKIFERFYRGSEVRNVAPGSGLGLYVARKIAKAHGGSLDLEGGEADGGTTLNLTLPSRNPDCDPR